MEWRKDTYNSGRFDGKHPCLAVIKIKCILVVCLSVKKRLFPPFTCMLRDTVCGHKLCSQCEKSQGGKMLVAVLNQNHKQLSESLSSPNASPKHFPTQPRPRPPCLPVQVGELNCAYGVHGKPFPSSAPGKAWSGREKSFTCTTASPFCKTVVLWCLAWRCIMRKLKPWFLILLQLEAQSGDFNTIWSSSTSPSLPQKQRSQKAIRFQRTH